MFEEKRVKQEGRVRVAEEEANQKAQVVCMKRVQKVAKESKKLTRNSPRRERPRNGRPTAREAPHNVR